MAKSGVISSGYADRVRRRAQSLEGRQGAMKLAVAEELWKALESEGVSQAELARRAGTTPQYITKVFKGTTNFTLESVVALFYHLGWDFHFSAAPQGGTGVDYPVGHSQENFMVAEKPRRLRTKK